MMSKYIDVLQQHIEKTYPAQNKDQYQSISIDQIHFQKMYLPTKCYLQNFINVTNVSVTFCDLRTLQNFPLFLQLVQLDVSNNGLQGTFEHLMKNRSLEYINASSNYISDEESLLPLKKFRKMSICLQNNPICQQQNCNSQLQHVKILKQQKKNIKNIFLQEHISLKSRNPYSRYHLNEEERSINQFDRRQHMMMNQLKILQRLSEDMTQNGNDELNRQRQLFQFIRNRYRNREQMISWGENDSQEE